MKEIFSKNYLLLIFLFVFYQEKKMNITTMTHYKQYRTKVSKVNSLLNNKRFLETNYSRGRAIGVFWSFHFDPSRSKSEILYLDPKTSSGLTFSKETHEAEPRGILFD